jgi:hypothetical protein
MGDGSVKHGLVHREIESLRMGFCGLHDCDLLLLLQGFRVFTCAKEIPESCPSPP